MRRVQVVQRVQRVPVLRTAWVPRPPEPDPRGPRTPRRPAPVPRPPEPDPRGPRTPRRPAPVPRPPEPGPRDPRPECRGPAARLLQLDAAAEVDSAAALPRCGIAASRADRGGPADPDRGRRFVSGPRPGEAPSGSG